MTKNIDPGEIAEIAEPLFDESVNRLLLRFAGEQVPEILGELNAVKLAVVVGKFFSAAKDAHRMKMALAFVAGLEAGQRTMEQFDALEEGEKQYIRGLVISQLDVQTDERQAEAISYLVDAYLGAKITRLDFVGILSEIKNTNPLLYYFPVDSIATESSSSGRMTAKGPTELLPVAFGHNTITGIGQWSSGGNYEFTLTELGQKFFSYVYGPMASKYNNHL